MRHILCLVYSLYSLVCFGQHANTTEHTQNSLTVWELLKYDAKNTAQGVAYAYTSPLRWDNDDFRKLTTLTVGVFALSLADETANEFFTGQKENYPQFALDFGFRFGKPQTFFALNAGLYGYGLLTKNEAVRKTSVLIISSAITAGTLQSFSKTAFGRARPSSGKGYDDFNPFSSEAMYHSFPSGHTVLSVTMAHAIAKQFDNTWVKIGIYSVGAITPITRLVEGAHWLTDVAVGTILSVVVVDSIDKFLFTKKKYTYKNPPKISWNFTFSTNQIGFIGTF
ncbi:phosphatase PAP2 family protein [Hanstruepera marina]|uniref:phosphatase PAP2 family protein n=1 Tax=Hanstruepera marina TaxID=2873265 RepID=UPI001CA79305|nr:phosphatase PAP2 family protein [Hanstruepera marina]